MFLFDPRVVTCADNGKSEQVAVEPQTRVGIADGDGAMIYAEEQLVRGGMPLRLPFVGREVDELQRVAVGIPEVEGFDAGGIDIPLEKARRAGGDLLAMRIPQPRVRALHVASDNGDVLKPAVIAARVGGNRAASRPWELHKVDVFTPEPHPHHPYARSRCTFQT